MQFILMVHFKNKNHVFNVDKHKGVIMKKVITIIFIITMLMVPMTVISCAEEETIYENESEVLSDTEISEDNVIMGEVGSFWTFAKTDEKKYYSTSRAKKVSADYNPGSSCTVSTSKTFSVSFSLH